MRYKNRILSLERIEEKEMKTFAEFRNSTTVASKPVYTRKEGEVAYDLAEDVFKPGIGINITKEEFLKRLKLLRNASLPNNWKGMTS